MKKLETIDLIAFILVIIGGLNWGLISINSTYNVIEMVFGTGTLTRVIYAIVGLSALWAIYYFTKE